MSSMPWVKLYTEMLDDVKVGRLTDEQKWRFVQLILLAAECDAAGALVTGESRMTHADVTWRLRCDINTLKSDISTMVEIGLLTIEDDIIIIKNWAKRQGPTQADKREQWRKRQEKRRNLPKSTIVTGDSPVTHADVTLLEEEEDSKRKREIKNKIAPNGAAPTSPEHTTEEIMEGIQQSYEKGLQEVRAIHDELLELFGMDIEPSLDTRATKKYLSWRRSRPPEETMKKFHRWWYSDKWRRDNQIIPKLTQIMELWPAAFKQERDEYAGAREIH